MPHAAAPADVFDALHALMHLYRARLARSMAAVQPGLTLGEARALMFVGRHPGATQKELVAHSGADKAQVARTVALLQERGWLQSAPSAGDRRSRCLQLSAEGRSLHQALRTARRRVSAELLHGCDAGTQAQLLALLAQLQASVEEADAQAAG